MMDCDKGQTKHLSSMSLLHMKENEDEQVNDIYINNYFNQTISDFGFCKCAATDVLKTTSIPLNSTPSTSVTATCWLQTMKPQELFHAECQAWDFFSD